MKILLFVCLISLGLLPVAADDLSPAAPAPSSGAGPSPTGAIDPVKEAAIRKVIAQAGTLQTMKQVMERMTSSMKAQYPTLPDEFWTRLTSESNMNDLLDKLVPIYDKYYSLDDLNAIIAFNDSPAGQHMNAVRPHLLADSMQAGQEWGRALGGRLMEEIQKEQAATAAAKPAPAAGAAPAAPTSPSAPKPGSTE